MSTGNPSIPTVAVDAAARALYAADHRDAPWESRMTVVHTRYRTLALIALQAAHKMRAETAQNGLRGTVVE